jgi:hypothetical protein
VYAFQLAVPGVLVGMVLKVLDHVLRSPTFGWTGAACCVAAGRVLFFVALHV